MSALKPINARVYQGAHRRYFSKRQAEKSYFWAALKRRCECEEADWSQNYPGMTCSYHSGDHRDRIAALLHRFLRLHFGVRS